MDRIYALMKKPVSLSSATALFLAYLTVILAAFYPALEGSFLWDDIALQYNYSRISVFSADNVIWALTNTYAGHYQPVTWISYMLDHMLWGTDPTGYHVTNIVLHAMVAVLVFLVFTKLIGQQEKTKGERLFYIAAVAALLFAIHPLRVESVVWITERRDLLSGLFYLLTIYFFLKDRYESPSNNYYLWSILFFILSLLSKAWGISLPLILLLIVLYLEPNIQFTRNDFFAKKNLKIIGYLLPAAIFIVIAKIAQDSAGASIPLSQHGIVDRLMQLGYGVSYYLYKTILPLEFSPLYSLLVHDFFGFQSMLMSAVGYLLILMSLLTYKRFRAASTVFLIYLVTILPVSGLAQSGPQLVADRYSYLSTIPIYLIIVVMLFNSIFNEKYSRVVKLGVITVVCLLVFMSNIYSHSWKNSERLWTHAIVQDEGNYPAWRNRGNLLLGKGLFALAHDDFNNALRAYPESAEAHYNVALSALKLNMHTKAVKHFTAAIDIFENYRDAYINRAKSYLATNRAELALQDLKVALTLDPQSVSAKLLRDSIVHKKTQ